MDDNYHKVLDENMALIETPLIAPSNSYYPQHYRTALYPYNITSNHLNPNTDHDHDQNANNGQHFEWIMDNILNNNNGSSDSNEKQSRYSLF